MSRLASFKQADLTRALRAMAAAHVRVSRVEVEPSGKIVLFTFDGPPPRGNSCDDLLEPGFMPSPITRRKHG